MGRPRGNSKPPKPSGRAPVVVGLKKRSRKVQELSSILGKCPAIEEVRKRILKLAPLDSPVLISGETGTGKELVARAIHALSPRAKGPFRGVNCAAFQETLLESEFFGHAPGAFTGATGEHKGFFQACHRGTLLLDEIGDMLLSLQPKLLRAIEEKCAQPLGSDRVVPADVRILCATNRDLQADISRGQFRPDLFFRLSGLQVYVPPLRERKDDILLLARHFIARFAKKLRKKVRGFSDSATRRLLAYSWPGNVRELQNCMEQIVALSRNKTIAGEDLPENLRDGQVVAPVKEAAGFHELLPLAEVERRYILHVLNQVGGNRTLAAEVLGLGRRTLQRKLHL